MITAWKSDIGKKRHRNEDFTLVDREGGMFFLADGMGGQPGGDVASTLAVGSAHALLKERLRLYGDDSMPQILAEALATAHSAVRRRGIEETGLGGMGTTLDIVCLRRGCAWVCHAGDSRVYLFRKGTLLQLTRDDNMAAALARQGISPEEIPAGARHILTQAVGGLEAPVPHIRKIPLQDGDILVLSSDGLTGTVPDNVVGKLLAETGEDLQLAADRLVAEANDRGGPDNVSVILIAP